MTAFIIIVAFVLGLGVGFVLGKYWKGLTIKFEKTEG